MLLRDLSLGLRELRKHPTQVAVIVLTFGLALGVNSAIFSVINAVLIRPLPFPEPDRLVVAWVEAPLQNQLKGVLSQPELLDLKEHARSLEEVAGYTTIRRNLTGSGEPQQVTVAIVSEGFLTVLGVRPALGRGFSPEEERPGGPGALLVSHGFWQNQFGSDPDLIGKSLTLDGKLYTVAGVMPVGFRLPPQAELWAPMGIDPAKPMPRGAHFLDVIGRLKRGVTLIQAQTELTAISARLLQDFPEFYPPGIGWGMRFVSLREEQVEEIRPALVILLCAGGLVLVIACVNVAHLRLTRAWSRRKDLAVQMAFGAGRGHVVRQLLAESLLLAVLGGGFGLLLAVWLIRALLALAPPDIPNIDVPVFDGTVFAFTLTVSLFAGLLAGLMPALRVSRTLPETLREAGGKASEGSASRRLRGLLVASEIALALLVVTGAGLLLKNLSYLQKIETGFDPQGVLTVSLSLPGAKYKENSQIAAFYEELLPRLRSLPEVESAGAVSHLPLSGQEYSGDFTVEGIVRDPTDESYEASRQAIDTDYFRTMAIPVLSGRSFHTRDGVVGPGVVIIDEMLARRFWPGESALGKRLKFGKPDSKDPWLTIVGVAGHVRSKGLDTESRPQMYFPIAQFPRREMFLVLRTSSPDPTSLVLSVREAIQDIDPDQPIALARTMREWVASSMSQQRFAAFLLTFFAAVALALATTGIYAVLASSASERTSEIGIRMALGALPGDVQKLLLRQSLVFILVGVGIGIVVASILTPLLSSQLHDLSPLDPGVYLTAATLLVVIALLATYMPAQKATRIPPGIVLRRS